MTLSLPGLSAEGEDLPPEQERLLIVLGGRRPSPSLLQELASSLGGDVWAVDGGADACMASSVIPQRLLGDCDSASPEALLWAKEQGAVLQTFSREKDLTDFQLALLTWNRERACRVPILTGAFGGRLDHLYSNLNTFAHMTKGRKRRMTRCMLDDLEGVFLLYSHERVTFTFEQRPMVFSLLPLTAKVTGVSISGVHWPLSDVILRRSDPYAISNEPAKDSSETKIIVETGRGVLCAYWHA